MEKFNFLNSKIKRKNYNIFYAKYFPEINENNGMNETTVKSSKDERNIHIRRKPTSAEKHFKCSCGKSYLCNESLYIHRKIKHPEE